MSTMIGRRFGKLVVERISGRNPRSGRLLFHCICDCGGVAPFVEGCTLYHRKSCGCNQYREPGESSFTYLLVSYKKGARQRGYDWGLEEADFRRLTESDCEYCGAHPSKVMQPKGARGPYVYNGVDRRDNSLGYSLENCVACCEPCNRAKGQMGYDEFIDLARRVVAHHAA